MTPKPYDKMNRNELDHAYTALVEHRDKVFNKKWNHILTAGITGFISFVAALDLYSRGKEKQDFMNAVDQGETVAYCNNSDLFSRHASYSLHTKQTVQKNGGPITYANGFFVMDKTILCLGALGFLYALGGMIKYHRQGVQLDRKLDIVRSHRLNNAPYSYGRDLY